MAANPEADEASPLAVGKSLTLSILKYFKLQVFKAKPFSSLILLTYPYKWLSLNISRILFNLEFTP